MDYSPSFSKVNINEVKWVDSMRKSILKQHDDEDIGQIPVCVFTVPKLLLATDPKSYIPQQVALGPFHHFRPELYDMQAYKLASARRTQKQMNVSFECIVKTMKEHDETRIRARYHKYLDMSGDTLVWMMAIDMAFLLEFLLMYFMKQSYHLVDLTWKKLPHMAILRDLVMVENQIPMFLIKKMLQYQQLQQLQETDVNQSPEETLKRMLMGLYHEFSPFHEQNHLANVDIDKCDHILDFLYHMTVPNDHEQHINVPTNQNECDQAKEPCDEGDQQESVPEPTTDLRQCMSFIFTILSKSNTVKKIIFGKLFEFVKKLPILKLVTEHMFKKEKSNDGSGGATKAPTIEEITIPSVTEMVKAGIHFSPVNGGISDIRFDVKACTLYLPVVELDVNTEVYLRNLVAYEACVAPRQLVVARYTELMNGIIDTSEDAKYLRERGIVLNYLKSDKEVADLWNGMSKSVKMTKVDNLDNVVKDVNKTYGRTWRVKLSRCLKTYVFASWKILTLLAALFMLLVTTIQAFCTVYSCARYFHQLPKIPGAEEGKLA
ncbi:hypothetical protein QVD17_21582 [Tagetes erecta]|uniref:Uncharacterized protein n=1 Tax=Tagetes erecta TaxID=13708 RepID=A0AAD8KFN5_TARER|nr:hypothetical protein QVD17_21582 [Tagetes erecta]